MKYILAAVLLNIFCMNSYAEEKVLKIYMDSDRTNHYQSANSIEKGIKTAFSEINNTIQGYKIEFIPKDHRGNVKRSKIHMGEFLKDEQALFMLAGLHSPPLIKYRDYINENGVLTLVPWAAGGPITRYPGEKNWVFRLSIDDTKAGYKIVEYAINSKNCNNPHLLLEETPWGKSNYTTMQKALSEFSARQPTVTWFNWNTKETGAKIKLRSIINNGADCVLFVGNAIEGTEFAKAMASLEKKVPIISHWGITGGEFHKFVNNEIRKNIDLSFIQTCFSFVSSEPTKLSKDVFAKAQTLFPEIKTSKDITAPTGFIHSYDLGKILIQALNNIEITDDMLKNRENLRISLENIENDVQGLIKTYNKPFSKWSGSGDSHEALDIDDFCMGHYGENDEVIVNNN